MKKPRVTEPDREFDPSNPYDAMCDMFRRQVIMMAEEAQSVTLYRELRQDQQLSAFMAGTLTGLLTVALGTIVPRGHDAVMKGIVDALPFARQQALSIIDSVESAPEAKPD